MDMSAYLATPLLLDKICRACLTEKKDMKPLYGDCLYEMFKSIASIQVKHDDSLPSLLCQQCISQCSSAYAFKQLCEKSDRILSEFMKPEFQAQIKDSVIPIHFKIEVDENCEVDQYVEIAHIKDEIESEFDSFTDQSATIDDDPKKENNKPLVRVAAFQTTESYSKPNTHVCTTCSKPFAKAKYLKQHAKIHFNKRTHLCPVCKKTFKWAANLSRHIETHTDDNLLSCKYCDKQIKGERKFKTHMRMHTAERPYSCEICAKTFPQVCLLEKHIRVHTGEKPYNCPICGKSFAQSNHVITHLRIHTGVKSHFCDICGKGFNCSGNLVVHVKTHGGNKSHVCDMCDMKFRHINSLRRHMKLHLKKEKTEKQTKICNKSIETGVGFEEHIVANVAK